MHFESSVIHKYMYLCIHICIQVYIYRYVWVYQTRTWVINRCVWPRVRRVLRVQVFPLISCLEFFISFFLFYLFFFFLSFTSCFFFLFILLSSIESRLVEFIHKDKSGKRFIIQKQKKKNQEIFLHMYSKWQWSEIKSQ